MKKIILDKPGRLCQLLIILFVLLVCNEVYTQLPVMPGVQALFSTQKEELIDDTQENVSAEIDERAAAPLQPFGAAATDCSTPGVVFPFASPAMVSPEFVCPSSGTVSLNIAAVMPNVTGLTYQWEWSADGVTGWLDIGGALSNPALVYSGVTADGYFRCKVYCTASSAPVWVSGNSSQVKLIRAATFKLPSYICSGAPVPTLPSVSENGIAGTWNPATISSTSSATYTFTPDAGQCVITPVTVSIIVANGGMYGQIPLLASDYNSDIIANGNGSALGSTSLSADFSNFVLVSPTFAPGGTICVTDATGALPDENVRQITSANTTTNTGITYTLQPYDQNNNIWVFGLGMNKKLTVATPVAASTLYLVGMTGNGPSFFDVRVNFTDNTFETVHSHMPDWCIFSASDAAYALTNKLYRSSRASTACDGEMFPYLFEMPVDISSSNQNKMIASVDIVGDVWSYLNIMALGAKLEPQIPVFDPVSDLCYGSSAPALPTISNNGIGGTWSPATVSNTASATYTFTPWCGGPGTSLDVTVIPLKIANEDISICANALPYTWNGIAVPAGGNGVATYTTPSLVTGCDSTTILNLTINPLITATEDVTICANQLPYTWNGIAINSGGNGVANYVSQSLVTGCDSTTTLNLTVNPLLSESQDITICADQLPYIWNGITVTTGGINAATYITPSLLTGCDSTTTLNLTVNPLKAATQQITICEGQLPYLWNGITVIAGGSNAATYTVPSLVTGCDSTTTLDLTVIPMKTAMEDVSICSGQLPFMWNGISVASAGSYAAIYVTPSLITGCDSTTILNLTVNSLKSAVQNITICADQLPYAWNGIIVNNAGNNAAIYTMPSLISGCDSTTTLNLTVNPLKRATESITICADQLPYVWNGINVASGGNNAAIYVTPSLLTGCDSTTTLNLTVNALPAISLQPQPVNVVIDNNTSFTVSATGTGPLTYQWEVNTGAGYVAIVDDGTYSNASTATLQITNSTLNMDGNLYRCVVTGICTTAITNAAKLTVTKNTQSISLNTPPASGIITATYGDGLRGVGATSSAGLSISYASSNNNVISVDNTGALIIKGAGTAVITISQAGDASYLAASSIFVAIQVNKKDLTVVANDTSRPYGENNPAFTVSYNGFVNGEDGSVVTAPLTATTALLSSMPGVYTISLSGGSAANYNLLYQSGTLTVTGAVISVDVQPQPRTVCVNKWQAFQRKPLSPENQAHYLINGRKVLMVTYGRIFQVLQLPLTTLLAGIHFISVV